MIENVVASFGERNRRTQLRGERAGMSLFEDDFYSTKVSRRARWDKPFPRRRGRSGTFGIAAISSLAGALIAVIIVSLALGGGGGASGNSGSNAAEVSATKAGDDGFDKDGATDRVVQVVTKVNPAVVSVISKRESTFGGLFGGGGALPGQDEGSDVEGQGDDPSAGDDGEKPSDENADSGDSEDGASTNDDVLGDLPMETGLGSGVIFQKDGSKVLVFTNNHVVEGAEQVEVVLPNGEHRPATIVGSDNISDLAVLEMDGKGIKTIAELGDSDDVKKGETVIAIGNPLGLGYSQTITSGIVSNVHQIIPVSLNQDGIYDWEQEVIQTDAAINQGNSGGALVDLNGRVIGINSMKIADMGVEGLGFAIPMNVARPIIDSLIEHGKVLRPYLGVYTLDLNNYFTMEEAKDRKQLKLPKDVQSGIIVLEAVGPAQKAGLQLNDVIVKLDDQPIGSTLDLRRYLYSSKEIGEEMEVTYYRGGEKQTLTIELEEKED